jgi:hypothetical protein
MTRDVPTGLVNLLENEVVYPFFAIKLNFDEAPIYLWTGVGTLNLDGVDYLGMGNILSMTDVDEGTDMSVRSATLVLQGVSAELIALALTTPYQGRFCTIYFGAINGFGPAGSLLTEETSVKSFLLQENGFKIDLEGDVFYTNVFEGYMDTMDIDENITAPTISLTIVNKLVDLERARVARFTSAYQKSKYPQDKGLDYVESIQEQELIWGRSVDNYVKKEVQSGKTISENRDR